MELLIWANAGGGGNMSACAVEPEAYSQLS